MLEFYSNLYKDEINITKVKDKLSSGEFDDLNVKNLSLFRIFLTGVFLLTNKETMEEEGFNNLADFYSNKKFDKNKFNNEYIQKLKKDSKFKNFNFNSFYEEKGNAKKNTPTRLLERVRNSFAHSQYDNFNFDVSGSILTFESYNQELGKPKTSEGVIYEPIFYEFVERLFSNNSDLGIAYRQSFFDEYSIKQNKKLKEKLFYSIKYKNPKKLSDVEKFLSNIAKNMNKDKKDFFDYIRKNQKKFYIEEKSSFIENYDIFFDERKNNKSDYWYTKKFFLDIKGEFSNFILHMEILNGYIMEYLINKNNNLLDNKKNKEILIGIEQLREDESSYITFNIMFLYLKCFNVMNISNKLLNDCRINKNISVKGFKIKTWIDYIKYFFKEKKGKKFYIFEKFRDALAHGDKDRCVEIKLDKNKKGELVFIFSDKYIDKKTKKETLGILEINEKELENFVSQEALYNSLI